MNELGHGAHANEALRRRFSVEGTAQGGPMLTMASDLFPTFPMSDDQLDSELHWLTDSKLAGGFVTRAADAGNQSGVGLLNPTGSGVIMVLQQVSIWGGAVDAIVVQIGTAATQTAASAGYLRDSRGWTTTPVRSVGQVVAHLGAFTTHLGRLQLPAANTMVDWDRPVVLIPGQRVLFATASVNITLSGSFAWRERPAAPYEQLVAG